MKKMKRLLALCLSLVLLCLCMTGCNTLTEMRKTQGFYMETGGIILNGTEYLPLPKNEYFTPSSVDKEVYVTEKDVPVLLSRMFGDWFMMTSDGLILSQSIYGDGPHYCRADMHAELATQMTGEFTPTDYCYSYTWLNEKTELFETRDYLLTKEQKQALDDVIATVEGVSRSENASYNYDYTVDLMACTDNMLLQSWQYTIEKYKNIYYITQHDESLGEVEYTVPREYNTWFDSIMACAIDAQNAEDAYYQDLYGYYEEDYDFDYKLVI